MIMKHIDWNVFNLCEVKGWFKVKQHMKIMKRNAGDRWVQTGQGSVTWSGDHSKHCVCKVTL